MSLAFTTSKGSLEQRWITYALLRDNVQHYLEAGQATAAFSELHAVTRALGGAPVLISAAKFHGELARAKEALVGRPIADLAISMRTRAILTFDWPPPERASTMLLSELPESLPHLGALPSSLDGVFGHLVDGLLALTDGVADDNVRIVDL